MKHNNNFRSPSRTVHFRAVVAPEPAKLHKHVWRQRTAEKSSFLGSSVASVIHPRQDMLQNDIKNCVKWCGVLWRDVMLRDVWWCDSMRCWRVGELMLLFCKTFWFQTCCIKHRTIRNYIALLDEIACFFSVLFALAHFVCHNHHFVLQGCPVRQSA